MLSVLRRCFSTNNIKPISEEIIFPRLERHYFENLYQDLMILTYDHHSPAADLAYREKQPLWNSKVTSETVQDIYLSSLQDLPTQKTSVCRVRY